MALTEELYSIHISQVPMAPSARDIDGPCIWKEDVTPVRKPKVTKMGSPYNMRTGSMLFTDQSAVSISEKSTSSAERVYCPAQCEVADDIEAS